jgi:copper transporter 1
MLAVRVNFYPLLAAADTRRNGGLGYEGYRDEKNSARHPWRAREATLLGFLDVLLAGMGYLLCV